MHKARIAEVDFVEAMIVRRHEKHMDGVKQCYAEDANVMKMTFWEKIECSINDFKVMKVDFVQMAVKQNVILAYFRKNFCALQTLVNAKVERNITLTVCDICLRPTV